MRPISNVVDVTNYVLLERNQPLHAFDLDRLGGSGIVVRRAVPGERITTLDGVERPLEPRDLLICDADNVPQAIAGVMGGATSEVDAATSSILVESAAFERMGIARTSKRLKLRSESSARFERGLDPDAVASNAARAMELLAEVAGARVSPKVVDEYPGARQRPRIIVRTPRVNAVLGTALRDDEVVDALTPLGIAVEQGSGALVAVAPAWRPDLEREIDLVEEIARRIGFQHIGRTLPRPPEPGRLTTRQRDCRRIADALVGAGFAEAITLSLVSPLDLERAGAPLERVVRAANPLRAEESVLRTRILPGLLRAVAGNRAQGEPDVALFEIGRVFLTAAGLLPDEPEHVALAVAGTRRRRPVEPDRAIDVYDALDAACAVTDALGIERPVVEPIRPPALRAGTAGRLLAPDGTELGVLGEVAPGPLEALGLVAPVATAELSIEALLAAPRRDRTFRRALTLPVVEHRSRLRRRGQRPGRQGRGGAPRRGRSAARRRRALRRVRGCGDR